MTHEKLGIKIEYGQQNGCPCRVVSCIKCASQILAIPDSNRLRTPSGKRNAGHRILNATYKHRCNL